MTQKFSGFLMLLLGSLYLSGCASLTPGSKTGPVEERDRGPAQPVDLSHVPDAVPRPEVRTRAGNSNPYTVLGQTYYLLDDERDYKERGIASWYGKKFHGRRTSNGEVYDMYAMTAAHKKLPIPSYVRVTNLDNGREVVVRVNDRGPFHEGRIIDLSYAAAQRLGFADRGVAPVEVEIIIPEQLAASLDNASVDNAVVEAAGDTYLQVGAFSSEAAAQSQARHVAELTGHPVVINRLDGASTLYRVRVGPFTDTDQLRQVREVLLQGDITQAHIVYDR